MSDYIDDGYTEHGHIAAEERIHGLLDFEYRPALPAVRDRVTAHLLRDPPNYDAYREAVGRALGRDPKLLQSWSLVNATGQPVEISEANLKRVKPMLLDKLWAIVSGSRASDLEADEKN